MKTIDSLDLQLVTGGAYPIGQIEKGSGSGSNDQLLQTLTGIQSSLKDLGKNQNQGPFSGTNGLLFVTMLALSRNNSSNTVVYQGGGGHYHGRSHGFRFRIW
jgi:hypothetical protein